MDMSVIKHADALNHIPSPWFRVPSCLCHIRYAGMSDRVSSLAMFEYHPHKYVCCQTVNLISQIIWYFLEGFNLREKDYPNASNILNNYQKYIVPIKDSDLQFAFYKSKKTGRWWLSSSIELDANANYNENNTMFLSRLFSNLPKRVYRIFKETNILEFHHLYVLIYFIYFLC